jgi:hypothetical protein
MTEGMPGFSLRGIAKQTADIGISLDIGHPRKIQVTPVSLGLSGKCSL